MVKLHTQHASVAQQLAVTILRKKRSLQGINRADYFRHTTSHDSLIYMLTIEATEHLKLARVSDCMVGSI